MPYIVEAGVGMERNYITRLCGALSVCCVVALWAFWGNICLMVFYLVAIVLSLAMVFAFKDDMEEEECGNI